MVDLTLIENVETFGHQPKTTSSWFADCNVEADEWLADRLIPKRSYVGIFGRRGSAKSFLALDLACRAAMGIPFLGEECERVGTVYCCGEKKSRFGKRIEAWRRAHEIEGEPVAVRFRWGCPNLLDDTEVDDFIAELNALRPEFRARGVPLGMVMLDTLARALRGANVSDADAAGTATRAIQRIIDEASLTVVTVAHVAKAEGSITQKGAGEWEDAADSLLRIERKDGADVRTVSLAKQSDEADGLDYAFELKLVEVGTSPKGKPVTSCVIRQVDVPKSGTKGLGRRLNAAAETVRSALGLLADAGQLQPVPFCPGVPPGTVGARVEALRSKSYALGLQAASEPPACAPQTEQNKWVEARKKAFQRALDKLHEAGIVRREGEFVWAL